jgi:hypothetical protein
MRLKLISCEVLFREMCHACAHSPHQVDLEFLPKGLHDLGGKPMAAKIQEAVDRTPEGAYEAILLGYALCGNGLDGLQARHTPLVLPRAHDCIALLMGSHERYQAYFERNPGTYYRSTGWLERGKGLQQLTHNTMGFDESLEAMIGKYGEDNGRYLFEEMTRYRAQYRKLTFIETGSRRTESSSPRRPAKPRSGAGVSSGCPATWRGSGAWWMASGRMPSSWWPRPASASRPATTPGW